MNTHIVTNSVWTAAVDMKNMFCTAVFSGIERDYDCQKRTEFTSSFE